MTATVSSTAIVGGGILGLTLALRLAQRGERVTIFERSADVGGLAAPWTLGGVTWDRHYHVTLFSDTFTRALLAELGLAGELRWTTVGTGFYTDGRFFPMNSAVDFLRFPPLGLIDKARLGWTIAAASRIADGAALEQISVEDWLVRRCGRATFEKIWRPLLLAKLGESYHDASAAFIWAIIVRLYAARRAGLGAERFGYVPGGYARVLTRLEARLRELGVELICGSDVTSVTTTSHGATIVARAGAPPRVFGNAVLTVPAPAAARLVPQLDADEHERLGSKTYGGIVCASVLLDEPLGPYYVTNLTDAWVPFSAVIDMANVVDRSEWNGHALVYLPKYVHPDDPIFAQSDAALEARFLDALERMYPRFLRRGVRAFRVSRVRHVFPIATLRYSQHLPPVATSVPGIMLLNSAHIVNGTLNVNETLALVPRAVAALTSERGVADKTAV